MKKLFNIFSIILISGLVSCKDSEVTQNQVLADTLSNVSEKVEEKEMIKNNFTFKGFKAKGNDSIIKWINKEFTGDSLIILKHLNRADKKYFRNLDTIIIPEPFSTQLLDYSPFPDYLDLIKEVDKMFLFAYPIQAFAVYEKGKLLKWGATSMGKKATKTPTGLNFTNWKGRKIRSSVNSSWILEYNFNIMNTFGVGWHQYEMPGYPASHSCLRLFMEDAEWLYTYADQWILENGKLIAKGNPVIVFGDYPWGSRRPWYNLIENENANKISVEALNEIIKPELDTILKEQNNRTTIVEQKKQKSNSNSDSIQA